jgi:hypothetical protein
MARDQAGTPAFDAWARRAGHLIASNQRLLLFPVLSAILQLVAFVPVVAVTRPAFSLDRFGQDVSFAESRVGDILGGSPRPADAVVVACYLAAAVAIQAWLGASFIRSIGWGGLVWLPGWRPVARLAVLYALAVAAGYALGAAPALTLVLLPFTFVVFGYADYAVVLEDRNPWSAIRRSLEVAARTPLPSILIFSAAFVADVVVLGLFATPLHDETHVFVPFLLSYALINALAAYVTDCALIAVLLEVRGLSAPGDDRRAGSGAGPRWD